jgi:hypothetical protein
MDAAPAHGLAVDGIKFNQEMLTTGEEKSVFMMGILESKNAILEAGVSNDAFTAIVNNAASIAQSDLPVGFVRNFQLVLRKI